jgi:hypothetical protein
MTKNKLESEFEPMPTDFWNHLYNPISGHPYSKRQLTYTEKKSRKYFKTYDVLEK